MPVVFNESYQNTLSSDGFQQQELIKLEIQKMERGMPAFSYTETTYTEEGEGEEGEAVDTQNSIAINCV